MVCTLTAVNSSHNFVIIQIEKRGCVQKQTHPLFDTDWFFWLLLKPQLFQVLLLAALFPASEQLLPEFLAAGTYVSPLRGGKGSGTLLFYLLRCGIDNGIMPACLKLQTSLPT